ncbi:hypothetical protein, partial [Pseudomonas silesiensis]|uniref:hypothetical protein n=1 Tax=Pseudomonas silesiensis TaxID=1853130 RepID=UPI0034D4E360
MTGIYAPRLDLENATLKLSTAITKDILIKGTTKTTLVLTEPASQRTFEFITTPYDLDLDQNSFI